MKTSQYAPPVSEAYHVTNASNKSMAAIYDC